MFGGPSFRFLVALIAVFLLPLSSPGTPLFRSRAEKGLVVAVVDRNGDALPGASVVVDLAPPSGSKPGLFQAVTNAQGEVALPDVPPGTYVVRACLNGLYVDFEAKTRVVERRPAYVVLSMAIGEPLDSACPRPRMVDVPISDAGLILVRTSATNLIDAPHHSWRLEIKTSGSASLLIHDSPLLADGRYIGNVPPDLLNLVILEAKRVRSLPPPSAVTVGHSDSFSVSLGHGFGRSTWIPSSSSEEEVEAPDLRDLYRSAIDVIRQTAWVPLRS